MCVCDLILLLMQREKYLPTNSQDAIFYLNVHNIKLLTRDSNEVFAVVTFQPVFDGTETVHYLKGTLRRRLSHMFFVLV